MGIKTPIDYLKISSPSLILGFGELSFFLQTFPKTNCSSTKSKAIFAALM